MTKSKRQEIANPEIKAKDTIISHLKKEVAKLCKKLSKTIKYLKKDGTPRTNSQRPQIKKQIDSYESEIKTVQREKDKIPEKVDISSLEKYTSFKKIDNELILLKRVRSVLWNEASIYCKVPLFHLFFVSLILAQ